VRIDCLNEGFQCIGNSSAAEADEGKQLIVGCRDFGFVWGSIGVFYLVFRKSCVVRSVL
jgi:hypothetical protein